MNGIFEIVISLPGAVDYPVRSL